MNVEFPKRKPTRLKNYDYSGDGAYFITICTHNRKKLFSNIVGQGLAPAEIQLSKFGEIANTEILALENRYNNIKIDKYVIMPNHIHLIVSIFEKNGTNKTPLLGTVIAGFKRSVTLFAKSRGIDFMWQRSYYDHIIRNYKDGNNISEYIQTNVMRWEQDRFYSNK